MLLTAAQGNLSSRLLLLLQVAYKNNTNFTHTLKSSTDCKRDMQAAATLHSLCRIQLPALAPQQPNCSNCTPRRKPNCACTCLQHLNGPYHHPAKSARSHAQHGLQPLELLPAEGAQLLPV
jgi:hypothetical protein